MMNETTVFQSFFFFSSWAKSETGTSNLWIVNLVSFFGCLGYYSHTKEVIY